MLTPKLLQHNRDIPKTDLSQANNIHKNIFSLKSVEKNECSASVRKTTFFQKKTSIVRKYWTGKNNARLLADFRYWPLAVR